jgi:bleomycin hydrolase
MRLHLLFKTAQVIFLIFIIIAANSTAGEGGLSYNTIDNIRASFEKDGNFRAMYNAITNNDINNLALNRDILRSHNDLFSHKLESHSIANQKSSGRCWLFAGLNALRPAVIEKFELDDFEFSQNYNAFWDKMEKANCFLEYIIEFRDRDPLDREMALILESPFGDGGYWTYVVALIKKYGVVPIEIMPETNSSSKTSQMNRVIKQKLRWAAAHLRKLHQQGKTIAELRVEKEKVLSDVYKMLVLNLGQPPTEFEWRFENKDSSLSDPKKYTPLSFYKEAVDVDLDDYVNIFDNPTKEYNQHFRVSMSRNMYDGEDVDYVSVPIDKLKTIAIKSLLDDEPVIFSCDVSKDQSRKFGIMAMDIYDYGTMFDSDMKMSKVERSLYFQSSSNHLMVFVGVDLKNDRPVKWLVENSWGDKKGDKGLWTLYDSWFDNYIYNIIVKKKYVPKEILKIFDQPVVILPPWDPMSGKVD